MFDLKKDENHDSKLAVEAADEATAPSPRAPVGLPEKPRGLPEMPAGGLGGRLDQLDGDNGRRLVVGPEIVLKGEISSCDRLVVEGQVAAALKDCREIEIAEGGTFKGKGQPEFERADIGGIFEGDLTAREHLVVRATGRVTGRIRFGELEIERGGQVIGDVQPFSGGAAVGQKRPQVTKTKAKTKATTAK